MQLRFSEVQQKEIIEAESGKFIGFIIDAEVCEKTGKIIRFHVSTPKKFLYFFQGEEKIIKINVDDILVIGKDVILVKTISE